MDLTGCFIYTNSLQLFKKPSKCRDLWGEVLHLFGLRICVAFLFLFSLQREGVMVPSTSPHKSHPESQDENTDQRSTPTKTHAGRTGFHEMSARSLSPIWLWASLEMYI